jgi:hypothetical protein
MAWSPAQLALFEANKLPRTKRKHYAYEKATHIAIADLLRLDAKPGLLWTHIASGEYRTEATAALLKRYGVAPGWPDLIFMDLAGSIAFLEFKRRGGRLSQAQEQFRTACQERGVRHAVCYSFAEAEAQLREWHFLRGRAKVTA